VVSYTTVSPLPPGHSRRAVCFLWHCPAGHPGSALPTCRPGSVPSRGREAAVIHLGLPLPTVSCGLPASIGRAALERSRRPRGLSRLGPLDLAPGGVYRAAAVTCGAGGLLHHRFTLTLQPWPGGGLLSVALSRGSPRVGVTDHPALWSPDLPHRAAKARRDRPRNLSRLQTNRLKKSFQVCGVWFIQEM